LQSSIQLSTSHFISISSTATSIQSKRSQMDTNNKHY
ncbi:unnamed protein product, partial [Rotaria magnacalcarata]